MALSAGTRLGPYEILAPIGAGGMGVVYRARDTRLGRDVAIKVSVEQFTQRFEHEARAIAALNHPHICHLYDVGPNYLVMELIEGTPLKGPLSLEKTLEFAGQILEALDAAHTKGITHRDLKPGNILVTKQGIKLLDFGLAKQSAPLKETDATRALTQEGTIVGTLNYISPEQLQAKSADARSDIFSFGMVLYEMLTGKPAFAADSAASLIAAILERPAPSVGKIAPPALDRVLKTCLAKDPNDRWQSARDLKRELEWIASEPVASTKSASGRSRFMVAGWIVAATVSVIAAILGFLLIRPAKQPLKPLVRLEVDLGNDVSRIALSPDGTRIAYVSQGRLFTRRLDQAQATELAGTEGAEYPFFSPDGKWIAYSVVNNLRKISIEGGTPYTLLRGYPFLGGHWGEDGNIRFGSMVRPLMSTPADGGPTTPVSQLSGIGQMWPQMLPGGRAVLYITAGYGRAEVMTLADGRRQMLISGANFARYLPSGHLVYVNAGVIYAMPFDVQKLEARGTPVPVVTEAGSLFDYANDGTFVYQPAVNTGQGSITATLQWIDAAGKRQPIPLKPDEYIWPRLSPDGKRLSYTLRDNVFVYDSERGLEMRLTFDGRDAASWSPDGRFLAFRKRPDALFWARADGSRQPQRLISGKEMGTPYSFSPDGERISYFNRLPNGSTRYIWTAPIEIDENGLRAGEPEAFTKNTFDEQHMTFSPDGRWVAYESGESGRPEIYVRAFPDTGGKWQISSGGGQYPVWSAKGRELFFRMIDSRMILVADCSERDGAFVPGAPRVWLNQPLADVGYQNFDVTPDGKRIIALVAAKSPESAEARSRTVFLLNFFDELRRRAPSGK